MGSFLDKPKTDKYTKNGMGHGLRYGVSSMQGWRAEMEDAHCAMIGLPQDKLKDWSFFAVFDGHAGARTCAKRLLEVITTGEEFSSEELSPESIQFGMKKGFLRSDDEQHLNAGEDESGSTAVGTLISPNRIFVANCGDSRMVLSRASRCHFSTKDQKPINPQEKWRVQNDGSIKNVEVDSTLSRASSDFKDEPLADEREWELLDPPEPDIFSIERSPEDEFAVLACDGVWDVMSNKELCDFVRHLMTLSDDLASICNTVVDTCLSKKSRETISIIIVAFPGCPQISKEAVSNDGQLDNKSNQLSEDNEPHGVPSSAFMLPGAFSEFKCLVMTEAKKSKSFTKLLKTGGATIISNGDNWELQGLTHAFLEPKNVPLPEDLSEMVAKGVHCLKPEFVIHSLTDTVDIENYYIPEAQKILKKLSTIKEFLSDELADRYLNGFHPKIFTVLDNKKIVCEDEALQWPDFSDKVSCHTRAALQLVECSESAFRMFRAQVLKVNDLMEDRSEYEEYLYMFGKHLFRSCISEECFKDYFRAWLIYSEYRPKVGYMVLRDTIPMEVLIVQEKNKFGFIKGNLKMEEGKPSGGIRKVYEESKIRLLSKHIQEPCTSDHHNMHLGIAVVPPDTDAEMNDKIFKWVSVLQLKQYYEDHPYSFDDTVEQNIKKLLQFLQS